MCGDHGLVGIIVWQLGAAVGHYWVVALVHLFVQNVVKSDIFKFYWDLKQKWGPTPCTSNAPQGGCVEGG